MKKGISEDEAKSRLCSRGVDTQNLIGTRILMDVHLETAGIDIGISRYYVLDDVRIEKN